jgi:hypothetical protein
MHFIFEQILVMMITRFPIFTVVFALLSSFIIADPCRFEHSRGIIDLTTVGRSDGNPAYLDKQPTTGSNWSTLILFSFVVRFRIVDLFISRI